MALFENESYKEVSTAIKYGPPDLDDAYANVKDESILDQERVEFSLTPEQEAQLKHCTERLYESIPKGAWDELVGISVSSSFRSEFQTVLEMNRQDPKTLSIDEFMRERSKAGLSSIYVIKRNEQDINGEQERKAWENHQPEKVAALRERLSDLQNDLPKSLSMIPEFIRQQYNAAIQRQIDYCDIVSAIGTPEFTVKQRPERVLLSYIDKSKLSEGKFALKYASDALDILKNSMDQPPVFKNVGDALVKWNFTEDEQTALDFSEEDRAALGISAAKIVNLFSVLIQRDPKLQEWKVIIDDTTTAIDVSGLDRLIRIPPKRFMLSDDVAFIFVHEAIHVARGYNGSKQSVGVLQTGMDGSDPFEEGLAVMGEMYMGEPFGHARQQKLAARYHAIQMALEVEQKDGEYVPKYTVQEIYNQLRDFKINEVDAKDIIWRIMRGTSLNRKVVEVEIAGKRVHIAETYIKDLIYFMGMRDVFEIVFNKLDLPEDDQDDLIAEGTRDFSVDLLQRIGSFISGVGLRDSDPGKKYGYSIENKKIYEAMQKLGKERILSIIQSFVAGATNLDTLMKEPEWNEIITHDPKLLVQLSTLYGAKH